jgi:hypothetical protein
VGNSNVDHMDDVFDTWPADGPTLEEHIASLEVTDDPRGAFVAGAKLIIKRGAFPTPNAIKALTQKLHQRTAIRHWRAS